MDWLDPVWFDTLRLPLLGKILLATALGGLIGLERELSGKPAGLRTNILICIGATLLMDVSRVVAGTATVGPADPGRIAAQVVSGIGFIGAGTILFARGSVVGLTTAATLWVVAAIGLAIGADMYVEAAGTAFLVALTLTVLARIEDFLLKRRAAVMIDLVLDPDMALLEDVYELFRKHRLRLRPEKIEKQRDRIRASFELAGSASRRDEAVAELTGQQGVNKITIH